MERFRRISNESCTTVQNSQTTQVKRNFILTPFVLPDDVENRYSEVLLKKTWTLYEVSSLFNCDLQNEVKLKRYAKRMREELAATLLKENVSYHAEFKVMNDMVEEINEILTPPLMIEVKSKIETKESIVYTGILISWRTKDIKLISNECVNLPLLLCRGTPNTMKAVNSTLSNMFDCLVVPLSTLQNDLKWILSILLKQKSQKESSYISMEYRIPGFPVTDTIIIRFKVGELMPVVDIVFQEGGENEEINVSLEQVEKFMEVLYSHMLNVSGLRLEFCSLHKISTSSLTISDNKMKVMDWPSLHSVLSFFDEKATYDLHTFPGNLHTLHVDDCSRSNSEKSTS